MKIPSNTKSLDVANYLGIKTLGKFKSILAQMTPCAKLIYFKDGKKCGVRVNSLLKELGMK